VTQVSDFKFSLEVQGKRQGFPLIRFQGVLKTATPKAYVPEDNPNAKPRMSLQFDFVDITVIDTEEPFPFPIVSITVNYSDRTETQWAAWAASVKKLIPAEETSKYNQPYEVLVGKVQEWAWAPCRIRRPQTDEEGEPVLDASGRQKWAAQDADAWQIVSVEGFGGNAGGASIYDLIVDYLDGKDDRDFMQWLFTDMSIKSVTGHATAVEAQAERKLIPMLLERGVMTQDASGIYHKAEKE
jgi:hypothetical protein